MNEPIIFFYHSNLWYTLQRQTMHWRDRSHGVSAPVGMISLSSPTPGWGPHGQPPPRSWEGFQRSKSSLILESRSLKKEVKATSMSLCVRNRCHIQEAVGVIHYSAPPGETHRTLWQAWAESMTGLRKGLKPPTRTQQFCCTPPQEAFNRKGQAGERNPVHRQSQSNCGRGTEKHKNPKGSPKSMQGSKTRKWNRQMKEKGENPSSHIRKTNR